MRKGGNLARVSQRNASRPGGEGQKKTPRSGERETCGACTLLKEGTDTVLLHCVAI